VSFQRSDEMLVVQDNLELIELIAVVLRLGGRDGVSFASTWFEAHRHLTDRRPHYVIIDTGMLARDGSFPFLERSMAEASGCTVIALSSILYPAPAWAHADLALTDLAALPDLLDRIEGRGQPLPPRGTVSPISR
jgi:DNA-binding NtrC family response regulator